MQKLTVISVLLVLQACNSHQTTMSEFSPSEPIHAASTAEFNLSDHQWQHRVLLIFAPSAQSPQYQQQMQRWKPLNAEINDRDLKLVEVLDSAIAQSSVNRLRQQFGIKPEDFAIILIGKDGSEKQRSTKPVDPAAIFQTIDAMPMRQQEMRRE